MEFDVIIIGSGPAGVQAAVPLVEANLKVAIIDGGNAAPDILEEPVDDFVTMRKEHPDQWRWFLGEDYSNIPLAGLDGGYGGGMASGNKEYIVRNTAEQLPVRLDVQSALVQCLAVGGLGAAWGAACANFSSALLQAIGLPVDAITKTSKEVEQLIGVSGTREHLQPPLKLNDHMQAVLKRYTTQEPWFKTNNLNILQPDSAILTKDLPGRSADEYKDMHYFSDEGRSMYRPQWTLEELEAADNFTYIGKQLVQTLAEQDVMQVVKSINRSTTAEEYFTAKKVIIAAGAVSTGRLLLQSFNEVQTVPLNAKAHGYIVCLDPWQLSKLDDSRRTSVCQLLISDMEQVRGVPAGAAQLYSYRSLQLLRLITSTPIAKPMALDVLARLVPGIVLADIRYTNEQAYSSMTLHNDTLCITSDVPTEVIAQRKRTTARIKRGLRKVKLIPLRTMIQPEGSCSHYAGTCPIGQTQLPVHTLPNGSVNLNKNVYIADSSVFTMLPAWPPTLTIMAYARHIGQKLAQNLKKIQN